MAWRMKEWCFHAWSEGIGLSPSTVGCMAEPNSSHSFSSMLAAPISILRFLNFDVGRGAAARRCSADNRHVDRIAVLTGGSAATVYAPIAYQSRDADFIITLHGDESGAVMGGRVGICRARRHVRACEESLHGRVSPGPLSIGDDVVTDWNTLRRDVEVLHILTRTDCIRDRLMWFYHYDDRSALAAAIGVAKSGEVDLASLRAWSQGEGKAAEFEEFASRL